MYETTICESGYSDLINLEFLRDKLQQITLQWAFLLTSRDPTQLMNNTFVGRLPSEGRFKCPELVIPGSKKDDIRDEEMEAFDHDSEKRWFGSIEKFEKYGIQDDFMFALGWSFYGARLKGIDDFRIRKQISNFGMFVRNPELVGTYAWCEFFVWQFTPRYDTSLI